MRLLCATFLFLMVAQASAMAIHKQCFQKEKSLAVLELAKDSISKARSLIPECDGGSNGTSCGKKERATAYIEAALELIEEAERHYPECNLDVTPEPEPTPDPDMELTRDPDLEPTPDPDPEPLPTDCLDVLLSGYTESGVYAVRLAMPEAYNKTMDVFCDLKTDGGGWTVLQRRDNYAVQEDFFRDWKDYKRGFGNITKDFWIGNDNIYYLSNVGQSEVRFDLQSQDFEWAHAQFSSFRIEGEDNLYKLHIDGYSGNAADSLHHSNQQFFSTKDRINDGGPHKCAAQNYKGGWWFERGCGLSNLNGIYSKTKKCDRYIYLFYFTWKKCEPLKFTEIKIRRKL